MSRTFWNTCSSKAPGGASALEISAAIEAVGGETNAFTTKEYTCYYARVLDADLPLAIDVICDLVFDSVLSADDVETERGVILEEIAMHDDEPGDEVHDLFAGAAFGDHPLGRPISGTVDSVSGLTRRQIQSFYHRHYTPQSIVITAAGNLDHSTVVALVKAAVRRSDRLAGSAQAATPPTVRPEPAARRAVGRVGRAGRLARRDKETEQAHLVLGGPAIARTDERRFALGVLNNAVGGGMSSRLFQEIREQRGLAYSVYSFTSHYADAGVFGVYAGCAPGKIDEVLAITRDQLREVADCGITAEEIDRGKGMLKGALVLGLEDTGSRMTRLGKGEMLYDRMLSVDEILARVDEVTADDVRQIADVALRGPMALAVIGPFGDRDFAAHGFIGPVARG